jgi:hypothetical protein
MPGPRRHRLTVAHVQSRQRSPAPPSPSTWPILLPRAANTANATVTNRSERSSRNTTRRPSNSTTRATSPSKSNLAPTQTSTVRPLTDPPPPVAPRCPSPPVPQGPRSAARTTTGATPPAAPAPANRQPPTPARNRPHHGVAPSAYRLFHSRQRARALAAGAANAGTVALVVAADTWPALSLTTARNCTRVPCASLDRSGNTR